MNVFEVKQLRLTLGIQTQPVEVLKGVDVSFRRGQVTCLIGPSGSGKSVLVKTLVGALPARPLQCQGELRFYAALGDTEGTGSVVSIRLNRDDRGQASVRSQMEQWREKLRQFWGSHVGYVSQHGVRSLDPTRPVGATLELAARLGNGGGAVQTRDLARDMLKKLQVPDPTRMMASYPAELSGGMAQRAVIALALLRGARLLLADEPTTALDSTSQNHLVTLLQDLFSQKVIETLVLVTHDFSIAERLGQEFWVMSEGQIVEGGRCSDLFGTTGPQHPVSQALLSEHQRLRGRLSRNKPMDETRPRLQVQGVTLAYPTGRWWNPGPPTRVLGGVDLTVHAGEIVGLLGDSGMGKSSLANVIARLVVPDSGQICLDGLNLNTLRGAELRRHRSQFQLLFQDVAAAVHPRMTLVQALRETATSLLHLDPAQAEGVINRVMAELSISHLADALPGRLSGGELRRAGLARVWLVQPALLIADEPTAGVDVCLRAGIVEILKSLAEGAARTAILLISHDVDLLHYACDRVLRLRDGRLVPELRPQNTTHTSPASYHLVRAS